MPPVLAFFFQEFDRASLVAIMPTNVPFSFLLFVQRSHNTPPLISIDPPPLPLLLCSYAPMFRFAFRLATPPDKTRNSFGNGNHAVACLAFFHLFLGERGEKGVSTEAGKRGHPTSSRANQGVFPFSFPFLFVSFFNRAACLCSTRFKTLVDRFASYKYVNTYVTYTRPRSLTTGPLGRSLRRGLVGGGHFREIGFTEGEGFSPARDRATKDTREGQRHGQTHRQRGERERRARPKFRW